MADTDKKEAPWSTRTGIVKPEIEEFESKGGKGALRATIVNDEGKEYIIEAYSDKAKESLKAAAEAQTKFVIRGPAYFTEGNVSHVLVGTCHPQGEKVAKKEKEPKAELTEEEKAAKAEAAREAAIERDKTRVPVIEGSVAEGDSVTVGGESVTVTGVGRAWELETDEQVAGLKERFPDVEGIEKGAKVQFAKFDEPEPTPEP